MEGKEVDTYNKVVLLPSSSVVAVAVNGKRKSKYVIGWSLDKFVPDGVVNFKLLHVYPRITTVPTPMGNLLPLSQVRDDVAAAYRKEIEWQTSQKILPYKKMFSQRKVQVDIVIIESDDVAGAIAEEISKCAISKLVIGASTRGLFSRKNKELSSRISACAPKFCTVYASSKGKLASIRPPDLETNEILNDYASETCSTNTYSSFTSSSLTDSGSVSSFSHFRSPSLTMQRFHALSTINKNIRNTKISSNEANHDRCQSLNMEESRDSFTSCPSISETGHSFSRDSSWRSLTNDNQSQVSDQASTSDVQEDSYLCESQENINMKLEMLRIELRHAQGMYAVAQKEKIDASRKVSNLSKQRLEEAMKLKHISVQEEAAKELVRREAEKFEAVKQEATYIRGCVEREAMQRREAEMKVLHNARENEKLETALLGPVQRYQNFPWEEIVSATSSFSEDLKIGMGAYGTVYKCSLRHTTAAVKVLHSKESHRSRQFIQELEILSEIRHPHMLLLLGACPDHGCLIYEYMENGSLEDRLARKDGTPPIPWFDRVRIAWEVASALTFLHNSKPKPIIHRDLKPANILLDHNLVSKIGDVGLSTVLSSDPTLMSTSYRDTGPVGTLSYIDPEYQRTGLISPKSDVYAFGMVILQLLTAKPAIALAHIMETAMDNGDLTKVLDPEAGNWPVDETKQLAELGLSCAELRRIDRPDLKKQVLPVLERLQKVADRARGWIISVPTAVPNHFICPILKDVMNDPCVAADGYTYDRVAIEKWIRENDNSPMTNLTLLNKSLIPNYTLLSAIIEWKAMKN